MPTHRSDRHAHWQNVYRTKRGDSVSGFRPHLEVSLDLLGAGGMAAASRVIDIGGGASTLVDDLLARGLRHVSVLDVSEEALAHARQRLAKRADLVRCLAGDVLEVALPSGGIRFLA